MLSMNQQKIALYYIGHKNIKENPHKFILKNISVYDIKVEALIVEREIYFHNNTTKKL